MYNENIFFKSLDNNDITFYWHYIENMFSSIDITEASDIQKQFSKLLFKQIEKLKKDFLSDINFLVHDFFFDYKQIGLEENDIFISAGGIMKKWRSDFNIVLFESKITSPFIRFAIPYYKKFDLNTKHKKWNQYFESLMLELYEYRNAFLHTGKVNEHSKVKLEFILPKIINRVRWDLINECKANPNLNFKELIELCQD